jgi:hypothetical protein
MVIVKGTPNYLDKPCHSVTLFTSYHTCAFFRTEPRPLRLEAMPMVPSMLDTCDCRWKRSLQFA